MQLAHLMPDIAQEATACKFYNCSHLHEPGCGVIAQVESPTQAGTISACASPRPDLRSESTKVNAGTVIYFTFNLVTPEANELLMRMVPV